MKFLTAILCAFSLISIAQKSEYEYDVKENKVEKQAYDFSLVINPVFTDISNDNQVMGFNPRVLFRLNTIMSVQADFFGSYLNNEPDIVVDNADRENVYNGVVAGDYKRYMQFNGLVTFNLWNDVFESPSRVNIPNDRKGSGNRYFLQLDQVEKMHQVGLRLGGGIYQNQLIEKGTEFDGRTPGTLDFEELENVYGKNYSAINYNLLNIGVSYERINHLKVRIKTDSIGGRQKMNHWKIYGDFFIAPSMDLSNMTFSTYDGMNITSQDYELQIFSAPGNLANGDSPQQEHFGFRVGFEFKQTGKYGLNYGIETGVRPGTGKFLARSYATAKVGVALNWRLVR